MSPRIAEYICIAFILWMFKRESARKEGHSKGLWIPTIWVTILASKPLSLWISGQNFGNSSDGSPMDRLLLVGLLIGGLIVLSRRKFSWGRIISSNRWLFLFFAFSGCSVIWSDDSASSLKFWIKDVANIVMVAVVLTEQNPGEAAKAVLLRCSYVLIPCSVLFTKYFPDIGRGYNQWTFQPIVLGVTTDKNALGQTLFVSGMVLCWAFVDWLEKKKCDKKDLVSHGVLGAMILWLLFKANCATALTCSTLGLGVMLGMRRPAIRNSFQRLNFGRLLIFALIAFILFAVVDVQSMFVGIMGRDLTLTGRTDIWARCLKVSINPLLGAGYCNFWWGDRAAKVSEGFYYPLNEAHSGYMETYLNLGLIGLGLLFCALGTRLSKVKSSIGEAVAYQSPRLGFLLANAVYNVTESAFSGLGVIWFVLLLVLLESPEHARAAIRTATEPQKSPQPVQQTDCPGVGLSPAS